MSYFTRQQYWVMAIVGGIFAVLIISTHGCTDAPGARAYLEKEGYRPLEVGGRGWFKTHRGEWYSTRFTAINPQGDTVKGAVTRGANDEGFIRLNED